MECVVPFRAVLCNNGNRLLHLLVLDVLDNSRQMRTYKGRVWGLVLLRAQLMHQQPIDQGLCDIYKTHPNVIGHSEGHAGIICCLLPVNLIHTTL